MHSNLNEQEVLDLIFRENSSLDIAEQEKNINSFYAIKRHLPSELFKTNKLTFNYNKGLSYIQAQHGEELLFKIPNQEKKYIEMICPSSKEFINDLDISEKKKQDTIKKYKDSRRKYWYIKLTNEEVLCLKSNEWEELIKVFKQIANSL